MAWRGVVVAAMVLLGAVGSAARTESGGDELRPLSGNELDRAEEAARRATVLLSAESCGHVVRGSAFGLAGRLVTNRHLVEGAATVDLARDGSVRQADVLAIHAGLDLAVVAGVGGPDLRLAGELPPRGAPVVLAGRPGGGAVSVLTSQVHLYSDGEPWGLSGDVLLLDSRTGAGWSGGPVLDRHGRVVAVLAAEDETTGLALAVPVTDQAPWLQAGAGSGSAAGQCAAGPG